MATAHVGCTVVAVGATGVAGWALITIGVADDSQPSALFTFTWYVPTASAPEVADVPKVTPLSKLNCKPAPVGVVTVIVPVATAHVG